MIKIHLIIKHIRGEHKILRRKDVHNESRTKGTENWRQVTTLGIFFPFKDQKKRLGGVLPFFFPYLYISSPFSCSNFLFLYPRALLSIINYLYYYLISKNKNIANTLPIEPKISITLKLLDYYGNEFVAIIRNSSCILIFSRFIS